MTHKHEWLTTTEDDNIIKTCGCGKTVTMTVTLKSIVAIKDEDEAPVEDELLEVLYSSAPGWEGRNELAR